MFAAAGRVRYGALAQRRTPASRQDAQKADSRADQAAPGRGRGGAGGLAAARQQLAVLDAEIDAAKADLAAAGADAAGSAQLNLGYTEISAPIDGYVGNRVGAGRRLCRGRDQSALDRPGAGAVGRCEFQGRPARPDEAGRAGDGRRRHAARAQVFHGHV